MTTPPPNQPPYSPQDGVPAAQPLNPSDEKLWATLVHVGGIFFSFVPALIGYLVLKDRGPFVRAHTATALNFQITMLIAQIVAGILWLVFVGVLLTIAISIVTLIFSIIAAIKANQGQWYTYPMTIKSTQ